MRYWQYTHVEWDIDNIKMLKDIDNIPMFRKYWQYTNVAKDIDNIQM